MNLFSLENKKVWVIGGDGYLGQSIIKILLTGGAKVLCADLDNRAQNFVCTMQGDRSITAATLDVRKDSNIKTFVSDQIKNKGIPDGLVILTYGSSSKSFE